MEARGTRLLWILLLLMAASGGVLVLDRDAAHRRQTAAVAFQKLVGGPGSPAQDNGHALPP